MKLSDDITKIILQTVERRLIVPTVKSKTTVASKNNSITATDWNIQIAKTREESMKMLCNIICCNIVVPTQENL